MAPLLGDISSYCSPSKHSQKPSLMLCLPFWPAKSPAMSPSGCRFVQPFLCLNRKNATKKMLISVVYQYIPYDTTFVYICVLYKMMEWQRKICSNWYGTYGTAKNGREKMRGPTSLVDEVLLMLQKSQTTTFWMVLKPCKSWDKLPISTGEFTGFLPNNRTSWSFFPGSIAVQFDTVLHPPCQALHIEPCDQHDEDNPCLCSTSIS